MKKKFTTFLPGEILAELRDEAAKYKSSVAEVLRRKLLESKNLETSQAGSPPPSQNLKNESNDSSLYPLIVEVLLLLREFFFERNAQILKKVDENLDKRFGKERTKII